MKYKLFASDFDSTLADETLVISQENKDAVKKAIDSGVKFVLCSGRSHHSLKQFEEELDLLGEENYGIAHNGAVVYKSKSREIIYNKKLENKIAIKIIAEIKNYGLDPLAYVDTITYIDNNDGYIAAYGLKAKPIFQEVVNLLELKEDITKILIVNDRKKLDEFYAFMCEKFPQRDFNMFFTAENLLEFTNLETSKGNALEFLADYLNIDIEETIATGDNYNDIPLIKSAGLGIAVRNAVNELLAEADYITENTCGNSAVAEVINKFILND